MTKQYSYKGYSVITDVFIKNQDVTRLVSDIGNISRSIDYPRATEYKVGEVTLNINDPDGEFSPNNANNFFVKNGGRQSGHHEDIEIKAGFLVDNTRQLQTIFKGRIIRLSQNSKGSVSIVCSDDFRTINEVTIQDFGIARRFKLFEDSSQNDVNSQYPIMDAVLPASEDSVSIHKSATETISPVEELNTEGVLDSDNYVVTDESIVSEGGKIIDAEHFPQVSMKSPYRYLDVKSIITKLMDGTGINVSVEIPDRDFESAIFASKGRPFYDLLGVAKNFSGTLYPANSQNLSWGAYVTDWVVSGDDIFFLFNSDVTASYNTIRSSILKYGSSGWSLEHIFPAGMKVWKMTIDTSDIKYVLGYDDTGTSIIEIATDYSQTIIRPSDFKPNLDHYYFGVGVIYSKPDSRRSLIYKSTIPGQGLYYAYKRDDDFGVARLNPDQTQESIVGENKDRKGNDDGLDFNISGNTLTGHFTFTGATSSKISSFSKVIT